MELTLDGSPWPPRALAPSSSARRTSWDPPPRGHLVALSALAVLDVGRRPIPRCRDGGPGQVDPDTEASLWRPANLHHPPRGTLRVHDPTPPDRLRLARPWPPTPAGFSTLRRREPSGPTPPTDGNRRAMPGGIRRHGPSRQPSPLPGGCRYGHPPPSHHLPGGIRSTPAWAHRSSAHPPYVSLSHLRARVEEER